MSATHYRDVMTHLKQAARGRGLTYRELAERVGMSESGLKKVFLAEDGSFERVAQLCDVLELDMVDVLAPPPAAPWRLTDDQAQVFLDDSDCWSFLQALAGDWELASTIAAGGWDPIRVEGWLAKLERTGVLRVTPERQVVPLDARATAWEVGPRLGLAVVAPQQDATLQLARDHICDQTPAHLAGQVECGFATLQLTPSSAEDLKHALRQLQQEFKARSRRERAWHGPDRVLEVALLTVSCPAAAHP